MPALTCICQYFLPRLVCLFACLPYSLFTNKTFPMGCFTIILNSTHLLKPNAMPPFPFLSLGFHWSLSHAPSSPVPDGPVAGSQVILLPTSLLFHKAYSQNPSFSVTCFTIHDSSRHLFYVPAYPCIRGELQTTYKECIPVSFRRMLHVCELVRRSAYHLCT